MSTATADTLPHRPSDNAFGTAQFWQVYDVVLAALVILVSTDTFNRFGMGSAVWAVCYAMAAARLFAAPGFLAATLRANLTQLAYPAACIASTLWSKAPNWSFGSGVQLFATIVIALVVGSRLRPMTLILLLFGVLLFPLLLSIANWRTGALGPVYAGSGGVLGIYTQKNMLGQNAMLVILAGLALMLVGAWRSIFLSLVLAIGLGVAALALSLSQSVTPMIVLPVSIGLLLVMCARHLNPKLVAIAGVAACAIIAVGPVSLVVTGIDPVSEMLSAFGKSSTLTGRTKIWDFGLQVLPNHWALGVGYQAFWRAGEFSGYAAMIQAIGGENVRAFHNFILEVWIGTGLPGLIGMLLLLWGGLWRTWSAYRQSRSVSAAFGFVMIVTAIILCLPGTGLYRQHESLLMLVVMFGASAMASSRPSWPLRSARQRISARAD